LNQTKREDTWKQEVLPFCLPTTRKPTHTLITATNLNPNPVITHEVKDHYIAPLHWPLHSPSHSHGPAQIRVPHTSILMCGSPNTKQANTAQTTKEPPSKGRDFSPAANATTQRGFSRRGNEKSDENKPATRANISFDQSKQGIGGTMQHARPEHARQAHRTLDRTNPAGNTNLAETTNIQARKPHRSTTAANIWGTPTHHLGTLRAMAVEFPIVHGHPNRLPFEGILTMLDMPSDKAPSGARGHRVILTREAAEAALPSLLGMAVDYKAGWDGHDARQKCGIITSAEVDGKKLTVAGYLFARDFPEFGPAMEPKMQAAGTLGMSYELADAHVADMRAQVWTLTRATFTGAAILLREKAAYRNTSFRVHHTNATSTVTNRQAVAAH
jgi:hypothetical protein